MNYDPCERCGSRFPKEFCSQFCSIFKMAKSKEIQNQKKFKQILQRQTMMQ